MILSVSVCSLVLASGCRNKLPPFELCVTLEAPGFFCANQATPSQKNGFDKPYKPGMICMESDQFNILIDEISARDAKLARFKYKK